MYGSSSSSGSSWLSYNSSPDSPRERRITRSNLFKNPREQFVQAGKHGKRDAVRQDSGYCDDELFEQDFSKETTDFLSTIPTELMLRILKFCGVKELCLKVNRLNRYLYGLANDEFLWKALYAERISTKKHVKLALHPRADYYGTMFSLDHLSDDEIRAILRARFVPEEEIESARRRSLEIKLRDTVPEHCDAIGCQGSIWKSSYMAAEFDATRTELTEEELLAYDWNYATTSSWSYDDDQRSVTVKFWKHKGPDGRWRRTRGPVDGGGWPQMRLWEMHPDEGMQVLHMPEHTTTRTDDWGWRISNGYVRYTSL
ncbi:hypothetical protein DFJ74DRAFT_118360 [Hyaloraphidium curvatum]|nr:hypothetical protein DFJ74DRAFT_118360 [Hyaloraphidium curvatum]